MALPANQFFDPNLAMWPDLFQGRKPLAPVRVGVDAKTGKVLMGWGHVRQSMERIFATPFHVRPLRRYVGSFVPHILGESAVPRIITRFYWAIKWAIDMWEPCYRIQRVLFQGFAIKDAYSPTLVETDGAELLRAGHVIFRNEGIYMPRGHLGDFTPESQRMIGLVGRGSNLWDTVPIGTA
jgi:phage baseplate assembly protein W